MQLKRLKHLKRGRAAELSVLNAKIFRDGGPVLTVRLTEILTKIRELDLIASDGSRSLIVPDYERG